MTRTAQIARVNCTEWISLHALVALCLVLGVVQYAESQAVQKWKTPNGTIYFGDKPPAGSTLLGVAGNVAPTLEAETQPSPRSNNDSTSAGVRSENFTALAIVLLVAVGSIAVAAFVFYTRRVETTAIPAKGEEPWPFYLKRPLSQPDQVLFFRLRNALPDHIVLAQVQLSRFLEVKRGYNLRWWNNRINRLSADFLVCAKDASVLAAIELDDSTHNSALRQEVDARKNKAIASAKVKLVRWRTTALPDEETIRREILSQ